MPSSNQKTRFDHLVIAAASLEEGVDYVRAQLGVDVPVGGVHEYMGTYNHVMQLGDDCYLEVISIDPSANGPAHPRWFDLDCPVLRDRLAQAPVLLTWIVNIPTFEQLNNLDSALWGNPLGMSRDRYEWFFSLRSDGALPGGGCIPTAIYWKSERPVDSMPNTGCIIQSLTLYHPNPAWCIDKLGLLHASDMDNLPVEVEYSDRAYFVASINTPSGLRHMTAFG